jgi:hypothetical protein
MTAAAVLDDPLGTRFRVKGLRFKVKVEGARV